VGGGGGANPSILLLSPPVPALSPEIHNCECICILKRTSCLTKCISVCIAHKGRGGVGREGRGGEGWGGRGEGGTGYGKRRMCNVVHGLKKGCPMYCSLLIICFIPNI
jgi:hypothetical protein